MNPAQTESRGSVKLALQHAANLLRTNPVLAEEQAREVLKLLPGSEPGKRILAAALRKQGKAEASLAELQDLVAHNLGSAGFLSEWGQSLAAAGRNQDALKALQRSVQLDPRQPDAWRTLGDQLALAGQDEQAQQAYQRYNGLIVRFPELAEAAELMRTGKLGKAEKLVREFAKGHPDDVNGLRMLADIGMKLSRYDDARILLERCLELAPDFHLARRNLAAVLTRQNRLEEAKAQVDRLLITEPGNANYQLLKATILVQRGEHPQALEIYERLLKSYPNQPRAQMNFGHTLKTVGRLEESIDAYRFCIRLNPAIGEAYWSLANLKTYRFSQEEIELMRSQVVEEGGDPDDQAHLAFALGKAYEDQGDFAQSFRFYQRGNDIRKVHHKHNIKINVFNTARQIKTLSAQFFADRQGWGCPAPDPIFIVGLPRSGSTLLEQILASHSQVEGTAELMDIIQTSRRLGEKSRQNPAGKYPEVLASLSEQQCRELGERYLETTRVQRSDYPFFIDKMPNNFQHVGLIHLILPNAKIIDARRHPMACCFSGFKQLFAKGQTYTYDLSGMGQYYRDYVILMDHWDHVLPGRVLRVQYEDMVEHTEVQIRRLLDYCKLPFEEQCLRFWETERAVRTPSAEQVRQPIYRGGLEQWRNFEPWLGPLKEALGPVLQRYPIGLGQA
jgi:tetratricopeptide (TPR) repeat protein